MNSIATLGVLFAFVYCVAAETCLNPETTEVTSYVTEDATILTNVAFTTQFTLKCSNGVNDISLYAECEGKSLPAVRLSADNKYQVSWTEDVKKARKGDYTVKLYDQDSYAEIRKAARNGESTDSVKPLAVVVLTNPGVYQGPWINSEFLAVVLAAVVCYAAFSAKSKLVA